MPYVQILPKFIETHVDKGKTEPFSAANEIRMFFCISRLLLRSWGFIKGTVTVSTPVSEFVIPDQFNRVFRTVLRI